MSFPLLSRSMREEFSMVAERYDGAAVLARETGSRMAQRLDYIKIEPTRVADIGCATGDGIRELQRRYPNALPLAVDYALPMLRSVHMKTSGWGRLLGKQPRLLNADAHALPLRAESLGLIWSNLMLQWIDDPLPVFKELHRVLEVGGLLMFASVGPETLKELRLAEQRSGHASTLRNFVDMHDIGDMLVAAGFADPVMDMEIIRCCYKSPRQFLADQRHLGVRNALLGSKKPGEWRQMFSKWEHDGDGFLLSFEIVFGLAWKGDTKKMESGRAVVSFYPR